MRLALVLGAALVASACGDNIRPLGIDAAPGDARPDSPGADAAVDAPDGSTVDAMIDAMVDADVDASVDAAFDAALDAAPDMLVLIDGAIDGPGIDGPGIDGPGIDGPGIDGPGLDGPPIDGPIAGFTFTQYVIDMIENRTANNTEPAPFSEFQALLDPDALSPDNSPYASLFP